MSSSPQLFSRTLVTITREQLNAFHSIDRTLYSRLVLAIGRNQAESMQVMALWLWLERHNQNSRNFIHRLLSFSDAFINMLAQESVACLSCVYDVNDSVPMREFHDVNDLPMLLGVLGGQINLFYFRENRVSILEGVNKIMNEVCFRVFDDIAEMVGNVMVGEGVALENRDQDTVEEVEPDQRTIFLTFSKGYPTSEFEVRDFFTRRFGNIIENIQMQDVSRPEEQALYAKLVVRSPGIIDMVLEGCPRAKFIINGKHVMARKYVRKHH